MAWTVYIHLSPSNKSYIGITGQEPEKRFGGGLYYKDCRLFARAINKYGWDNFQHIIWANNLTAEEAAHIERLLIAIFHTNDGKHGYNLSSGGEHSTSGVVWSDETNYKRSVTMKGRPVHQKTLERIIETRKRSPVKCEETGSVYPSARNAYLDTGMHASSILRCCKCECPTAGGFHWAYTDSEDFYYGKPKEEVFAIRSSANKEKKPVVCIETQNIYESAADAQRQTRINYRHISEVCHGNTNRKTAGGYHWKYMKEAA